MKADVEEALIRLKNLANFHYRHIHNTTNNFTTRVMQAISKLKSTHSLSYPSPGVVASLAHQRNLLHVEEVAKDDQTDQIPQEEEVCF